MRADGSGAKPKYGYIAITFSRTARYGRGRQAVGDAPGDNPKPSLWIRKQVLRALGPRAG